MKKKTILFLTLGLLVVLMVIYAIFVKGERFDKIKNVIDAAKKENVQKSEISSYPGDREAVKEKSHETGQKNETNEVSDDDELSRSPGVGGKYLGGRISLEVAYGSGPNQLGKGESHEFEMGPASFFVNKEGIMLILDQFNHRVMKKSGKVISPLFTYENKEKMNFSDIYVTPKGEVLLLDGYDSHEIVRFSKTGERLGSVQVKLEEDDEPRHIVATKDGTLFVEGMFGVYRLAENGVSRKVPGTPFYNNSKKFVQVKKIEPGVFDANIVGNDEKVTKTFHVEVPYGSIPDVFTDAQDYVYFGFGHVISEPSGQSKLKDKVPRSLYIVQIYGKDGKLVNALNLERKEFVDYERGVSITKDGKLYRFVSSSHSVKILEHELPKTAKFTDPNSKG